MSETTPNERSEDRENHPHLDTFFKYCSDDDRVIKGIFEDHKIRFTQPCALNDPLEANPTIRFKCRNSYRWFLYEGVTLPSRERWIRLHLIERRINGFGILSLTEVPNSFDMWSRYANGHKGFLVGLRPDFNKHSCMLSRDGEPHPVRRVEYPTEHALDIEELVDEKGGVRMEALSERLFYQKVLRWQAEREHRMVRPLSDLADYRPVVDQQERDGRIHLFPFSLDCVLGIAFGACMSVENKRRIVGICEKCGVSYSQAWIVRDEREEDALGGRMGTVRLGPPHESSRLIDMCPCILDSVHIDQQKNKQAITSLQDLPYWNDDPAWVQEFYENLMKRKQMES